MFYLKGEIKLCCQIHPKRISGQPEDADDEGNQDGSEDLPGSCIEVKLQAPRQVFSSQRGAVWKILGVLEVRGKRDRTLILDPHNTRTFSLCE